MPDAAFLAACAVLGLSGEPTVASARSAYRARAALLHPDVHQAAGGERTSAATMAMQQLNDAYHLVLRAFADQGSASAADTGNSGNPRSGIVTVRCPRCATQFKVAATEHVLTCAECGQRLRPTRPEPASADGTWNAKREVVYSTRSWATALRGLMELALGIRGLAHAWENGDLVVDKADEAKTDECVRLIDELADLRPARRHGGSEVCYSTAEWTSNQRQAAGLGLRCIECRYYLDGIELVVDKSDEDRVDLIVELLVDRVA